MVRSIAHAGRPMRVKGQAWVLLGTVESETTPGVFYDIKRREADGHLGCGCTSYRFAKGIKTCKHLEAWTEMGQQQVVAAREGRATRTEGTVLARGERHTVRAISFGWGT